MRTLKVIIHTENPHDHQKVMGTSDCVMTVLSRQFCEKMDLSKIDEMKKPALYLLVDEERKAYIGQTRSFNSRVKDHLGKKKWWTRAYVFVSDAGRYNTASIEYLEYLAIQEGLAVGIYDLSDNWQIPTEPTLQKYDRNEYDEIFEGIKFFLEYERCFVFVKPEVNAQADTPLQKESIIPQLVAKDCPVFYLNHTNHTCVARGYPLNDGTKSFVVLKGSEISVKESNTKGGSARVEMLKHCTLCGDEKYVLNEDLVFKTPSGASGACFGQSSNGYEVWKTEAGVTLKSYLENLKQTHP
jgi:GIY-YIG catalytic domain protein